jgi:hypothetical protein
VQQYLVELYASRRDESAVAEAAARACAAAEALAREGKHVHYLRSIFVPEDEVCFNLYEAQDAEVTGEASLRAEIPYERIMPAVTFDRGESDPTARPKKGNP